MALETAPNPKVAEKQGGKDTDLQGFSCSTRRVLHLGAPCVPVYRDRAARRSSTVTVAERA